MVLTEEDAYRISTLEDEINESSYHGVGSKRLFCDLTELTLEIINRISTKDKEQTIIIYDYAKLLQREVQLYSCEQAYIMGKTAGTKPLTELMSEYFVSVKCNSEAKQLSSEIQHSYEEISELLGDRRDWVDEFTATYREIYGVIAANIEKFITLAVEAEK